MSFLTPSSSSSLRALHQGKQDDNDSEAERDINIKNLSFLVVLLMGLLFWLLCLLWSSRRCDSRHDQQQAHNRPQQRDEQDRDGPQRQSEDDDAASPTVWDNPRMLQEYYRRSMARAAARRELSPERRFVKQEELRQARLRKRLPFRIVTATQQQQQEEEKQPCPISDEGSEDALPQSEEQDKTDENVECCSICLGSFQEGEKVATAELCRHEFHFECLLGWLTLKRTCPVCRKGVLASDGDNDDHSGDVLDNHDNDG